MANLDNTISPDILANEIWPLQIIGRSVDVGQTFDKLYLYI